MRKASALLFLTGGGVGGRLWSGMDENGLAWLQRNECHGYSGEILLFLLLENDKEEEESFHPNTPVITCR